MSAIAPTAEATSPTRTQRDELVERAAVPRRPALYHVAAAFPTAGARAAHRVRAIGVESSVLEPSTLFAVNHPREADPAVAVAALYPHLDRPWRKDLLVHFTLRDDLHRRGFFAGYPLHMPLRARRLLFPIELGCVLDGPLPCPALRSARRILVADLLHSAPEAELDELLRFDHVARLRARARELRPPSPRTGRDVLSGRYADLLWRVVRAEDAAGALAENAFADRAVAARADFGRFVEISRRGGVVLISPEGSSPDGALQPLKSGVGALVRIARPRRVVPLGIAYDPLVRGRTHAYVGVGTAVPPPRRDADGVVRSLLARTVPLTVGQVVADALADGDRRRVRDRLERALERAAQESRPVRRELFDRSLRARRVADALAVSEAHPERLPRLVAAYRSARA